MKKIQLSGKNGNGKFMLVDDEDYDMLMSLGVNFFLCCSRTHQYARFNLNGKTIRVHRYLMNPSKGMCVDHINHDTLDNRRSNLRVCTYSQNAMNSKSRSFNSKSKYKGVSWEERRKKWRARVRDVNNDISLGCFKTEIEAAKAYNKAAKELFGEFAYLNNIK